MLVQVAAEAVKINGQVHQFSVIISGKLFFHAPIVRIGHICIQNTSMYS